MAAKGTNPQYRLEEPETRKYIAERADGSHALASAAHKPLGFGTFSAAAEYSSTRLHATPHEIVRVDA